MYQVLCTLLPAALELVDRGAVRRLVGMRTGRRLVQVQVIRTENSST